jgi:hypothetical protein
VNRSAISRAQSHCHRQWDGTVDAKTRLLFVHLAIAGRVRRGDDVADAGANFSSVTP